jgi:N-acetylglucosaminyldiphosphoundecaprenol N-acetyl-beta-D-mannosaminyltransferase
MKVLPEARRPDLCGVRVDALLREHLIDLIEYGAQTRNKLLILNHNLHSLYLYQTDPEFAAAYGLASWVYIDGMPVVWLGNALGLRFTSSHRITFLDCFEDLIERASRRGWRVFYLGSTEHVLTRALHKLRLKYPAVYLDGHNGFFARTREGSEAIIARINEFKPDILFVGMGMPIQEKWLAEHYSRLNAATVLTSGGTLDYVNGDIYRPPAWAGPLGLYGAFRLFSNPRRLWRRYLLEPVILACYIGPKFFRQFLAMLSSDKSLA